MKFSIPYIILIGIITTSCATSNSLVSDDIYMVKPSELPIGESTADEVSYASFKSRKQGNTNDRMTYADEMAMRNRQNCLDQWMWYEGCGCSYVEWARSSRYSPHSRINNRIYWGGSSIFMGYGYHPYVGYWAYNYPRFHMYPYHHNPYMGWGGYGMGFDPYFNNPYYGYGYGFGYGWGGHPYGYYGYGYGGYGYGGNMNGWSNSGGNHNSGSANNVIRGPRGTSTGYYNPGGRTASSKTVKSAAVTSPNGKGSHVTVGKAQEMTERSQAKRREVTGREIVSRPATSSPAREAMSGRNVNTTGTTSPQRTSTAVETQRGTNSRINSNYQGTYPSRTNTPASVPGSRNNGTINRNSNSSGSFERSSSPSQPSRSTISSPSRGSSGGGTSPGSSGGSRSGGSAGSGSSGRR